MVLAYNHHAIYIWALGSNIFELKANRLFCNHELYIFVLRVSVITGLKIIYNLKRALKSLLLWHMVGQGPAVLAAGVGWMGYVLFYFIFLISSILSSFSNASSVGRWLDILKYCGLGRSDER